MLSSVTHGTGGIVDCRFSPDITGFVLTCTLEHLWLGPLFRTLAAAVDKVRHARLSAIYSSKDGPSVKRRMRATELWNWTLRETRFDWAEAKARAF